MNIKDELKKNRRHLSYSQMKTYLICPLKYYFQYIRKIQPPFTNSFIVFGWAIHSALNAFYQAVLEGRSLNLNDLVDIFQAHWKSEEEKREIRYSNGENKDQCLDMGKKCLMVFLKKVTLPHEIIGLEEPFSIQIGNGVPNLIGRFDLIERDSEGTVTVADFKTSKKRYSDNQPNQDLQMTTYSLGIQTMFPEEKEVLLRLDVLLKQKTPDMERYYTVRDERDRERFIKLARGIHHAIQNGAFYPDESTQNCSNCPYQENCRDW